jgi:uncharacterized protein DUF6843
MILPYLAIALLAVATAYSAIVSFREAKGERSWIFPQAASRLAQFCIGVFTLLLSIAALWLGTSGRNSTHRSSRFVIPEGYTGWIRIEFEVQGAPPLPMEGGQYVIKIPPSGTLQTSSPEQYGWADDRYDYYSAQGTRPLPDSGPAGLIWGKLNGEKAGASGTRKYEEFFVGTQQQFKDQPNKNQFNEENQKR